MKPEQDLHRRRWMFTAGLVAAGLVAVWLLNVFVLSPALAPKEVPFSTFMSDVEQGSVARARIEETRVIGELKPASAGAKPQEIVATRLPGVDDKFLYQALAGHGVVVSGEVATTPWWQSVLVGWLLPLLLLAALWNWGFRRMGQRGAISFGRSAAKIYDKSAQSPTTFADVAGAEEAKSELKEIVDFLRSPARYLAIGARMPKGVLLVGAPGTGKTLLARAIAGEAGVPFFSISGSEFVELFVGLGAARIRNLFEQAKERAPCIVFIDEIDAIGKSRAGVASMASHDEREQTLNQLLVELDGFQENAGVILMAATNRPELLDPALVRAGRFDRQVVIERPDVKARAAILALHAKKLKLAPGIDFDVVARRTPGMVGADLSNVVNEAALTAARRGSAVVEQKDLEDGLDRVVLGLAKVGVSMSDEEKKRVAVHESGHAVVARSLAHADPVHRVSIVPHTIGALGVTLQLPEREHKLVIKEELEDRLAVLLGGRAAELALLGTTSTGAADDLDKATAIARDMVTRFGMDEELGPMSYAPPSLRFLAGFEGMERPTSEASAARVDDAVRRTLDNARRRADDIVRSRRPLLEALVQKLIEKETVDRDDLAALWAAYPPPPAASPPAGTSGDRKTRAA